MYFGSGKTFAQVYKGLLEHINYRSHYKAAPRDMEIKETLNVMFEVDNPLLNLYKNERRSSQLKYIAAETIWYLSGKRKIDYISDYARMWKAVADEDDNANSQYGHLIWHDKFNNRNEYWTQYYWALYSLIKDHDSRQAIIHFNNNSHQYSFNKDFVCTMYAIFHIRNNRLYMTVHMRSSDIVYGLPTDYAWFTILFQQMYRHLLHVYPKLEIGTFTYIGNSLHLYEKHYQLVSEMLKHQFYPDSMPLLDFDMIKFISDAQISINDIMTDDGKDFINNKRISTPFKKFIWKQLGD